MRPGELQMMSVAQLVERFEAIALAQDEAILYDEIKKFNRLFGQMENVKEELKSRVGDQRRALMVLYEHPNAQVRLKAAKATLAVAPQEARRLIEVIADSHEFPQAGDAGMTLLALDEGIFKPT
ncbi:MAG: DUF2019 domain-containing protein [Alphaproteobacteria bacterium]|nr:DUF2019 domain-containing protein [Alphaproteobacteria bacterium]